MALTDTAVRNARKSKKAQKITDGKGLYLEVRPNGKKLWRYRYRIDGKENLFALGEYLAPARDESAAEAELRRQGGVFTLSEARLDRDKARALVKSGTHPSHARKLTRLKRTAESANTFEAIGREWHEKRKGNWSAGYAEKVLRALEADAFPDIGSLPIRSVTAAHLLVLLQKVEKRTATMALMLRQWCSAIFRYAVSTLRADADPAAALKGAIQVPRTDSHQPLSQSEIPTFLKRLAAYGGHRTTVIAVHLLLLTFVRTIELRGGEWAEIDLKSALWRIPKERMKMDEDHVVPLSRQAVALFTELKTLTGGQKWLFPNNHRPKLYIGVTTINRVLQRMGYHGEFSAHGFRATASTILNEMAFRPDVIERQLAHKERNKTRASYNQAEYLEERRQMMQHWADYLDQVAAGDSKVVPLRKAV
jgi:integrase